jgi:hypothetical protein
MAKRAKRTIKNIKLKVDGISSKQWTNFVIELNLMAKAWKPYGVDVKLQAPGVKNIIAWGRKINESYKN